MLFRSGLAVLKGNIAQDGCVVKTAGVDESIWKFTGPAKVFDSQDAACDGILGGKVVSGDVVVIYSCIIFYGFFSCSCLLLPESFNL